MLHGAEKVFSVRPANKKLNISNNTSLSKSNNTASSNFNKPQISSSNVDESPSHKKLTGLLPVIRLEICSSTDVTTALVMCDSCCTHSWVSAGLAQCLNLSGHKLDIQVNGFNLTEDSLSVGSKTIDVPILQDRFPYLQPIKPIVNNYSDVEMILGQDVFHAIKPLEYFQRRNRNTPVAVRMPIGWVLSGALPSAIGVRATTFKCNVEDVALADQLKKWYELESYGLFKQAHPCSSADKRAQKFLDFTTLHDGSRYFVGMFWAEDNIHLPDNFYASMVQFKSLEKRVEKDLKLEIQNASDIRGDVKEAYLVPISPHDT